MNFEGMFIFIAFTVVVSLLPVIAVWWKAEQTPLIRKLALSAAQVAMNVTLLLYIGHAISLGYGRGHYRGNLKTYGELLETATPEAALTYTRVLKEEPMHLGSLREQAKKEK